MGSDGKGGKGREREWKGKGDRGNGRDGAGHGMGREGKEEGEGEERGYSSKLKFLAAPVHERRQSTRLTSDLDPHFVNPGSTPELIVNKVLIR